MKEKSRGGSEPIPPPVNQFKRPPNDLVATTELENLVNTLSPPLAYSAFQQSKHV